MIYGAIGYSILKNSDLFQNTQIILISDNHDEQFKNCGTVSAKSEKATSESDIQIETYLGFLLDKNYIIMIEEIPDTKDLVSLFPNSVHVNNIRNFYINNKDNKNLIPIDVRFELIDNYDEVYYNEQLLKDYIFKIYDFFMFEHKFFNNLSLYSNLIDKSLLKNHYKFLLDKFLSFVKLYKKYFEFKIKDIIYKSILIDKINDILSDIMELYILIKIYDILKEEKKIIIYAGLYHIDNIKKLLIKYYKYKEIETYGSTNMDDISNENRCIKFIPE